MDDIKKPFTKVVLTYTAAGLGHLRVTNALFEAAPKSVKPVLLRSRGQMVTSLHRLTSGSKFLQKVMEWTQHGVPEYLLTRAYNVLAHAGSKQLFDELLTLLEEDFNVTKRLVLICTHFGLAHEISVQKERLSKTMGCEVFLVVVVTDASPQKVWVVSHADLTVVPSLKTGIGLQEYAVSRGWQFNFSVNAYPLSPKITKLLTPVEYKNRLEQLNPKGSEKIHVLIPVSGAAAGLSYYKSLITYLSRKNKRFFFYVVSKEDMYTRPFLEELKKNRAVSFVTSKSSREIIKFYTELVNTSVFSLEIVKPSEQSFKAILPTDRRGGFILSFSSPVGRQEYDNLSFLNENDLIPKKALELTGNARKDAIIINTKFNSGELFNMTKQGRYINTENSIELSPSGAHRFWEKLKKGIL